ncbi:MAG: FAD:protein FMN transferase [Bacteroidota bacterium]
MHSFTKDTVLMGVSFSFTAVCESEEQAIEGVNAASDEVIRIEKLISSWDPHSQTSDVNNNAGIQAVQVDQELIALIERSLKISELTNGYFDITFASLDEIWRFDEYKTEELPSQEELLSSVSKIGYKNIIIDKKNGTVFLKDKGMKMGFGAIGKGYAANRAMLIMKDLRIKNGVVNAGGDLINWGKDKDNQPWTIGITDPKNKDEVISWLNVSDLAIVTSGNYEKFVEINGKRYSHIINPKTGMPVENLSSVSILCPDAEFADALATSIFILGKSEGMKLVNHLDQVECIIIDDQKNIFTSNNLEKRIWLK